MSAHRTLLPRMAEILRLGGGLARKNGLVLAGLLATLRPAPADVVNPRPSPRAEPVALATLASTTLDAEGETLGGLSSLAVVDRRIETDGTIAATLLAVPDRGYNRPEENFYSAYRARLQRIELRLSPPTAVAPAGPWSATLHPLAAHLLLDEHGEPFTGLDASDHRAADLPGPAVRLPTAPGGRVSLDAEGLALSPDGGAYVSDEYGPLILRFGPDWRLVAALPVPESFLGRRGGRLDFSSARAPRSGRRNNQGIEGLSLSPDGTRLFALTQSGLVQDGGDGHVNRRWPRLLIFQIDPSGQTPPALLAHHVLELPLHPARAGGPPARTAAQSALLALDNERFLVLSRDNHGLGSDRAEPPVFKSVLSYRLHADATNLVGTEVESRPDGQVAKEGKLLPDITPLRGEVVLDLLSPEVLALTGLHLDPAGDPAHYFPEKWESLALLPGRDPSERYLLVGTDNDYLTPRGHIDGRDYSTPTDNPTRLLVFRLPESF